LEESCAVFTTSKGRVYRPREGDRLVLFLKDLNLPKPDAYDTIQLIAFLQQLITYQGFWDHNREWMGVERVQIVASMNPATTVGRHQLSTRFTAITRVAFLTYPDHDQLQSVYTTFLRGVLLLTEISDQKTWRAEANIRKLAGNMVCYTHICPADRELA
jgi:dynein heavy chain 2